MKNIRPCAACDSKHFAYCCFSPGSESILDKIGNMVNMGHELHLMFLRLHFMLFGVSISFVCA
jgi:hypothetical protein